MVWCYFVDALVVMPCEDQKAEMLDEVQQLSRGPAPQDAVAKQRHQKSKPNRLERICAGLSCPLQ